MPVYVRLVGFDYRILCGFGVSVIVYLCWFGVYVVLIGWLICLGFECLFLFDGLLGFACMWVLRVVLLQAGLLFCFAWVFRSLHTVVFCSLHSVCGVFCTFIWFACGFDVSCIGLHFISLEFSCFEDLLLGMCGGFGSCCMFDISLLVVLLTLVCYFNY